MRVEKIVFEVGNRIGVGAIDQRELKLFIEAMP